MGPYIFSHISNLIRPGRSEDGNFSGIGQLPGGRRGSYSATERGPTNRQSFVGGGTRQRSATPSEQPQMSLPRVMSSPSLAPDDASTSSGSSNSELSMPAPAIPGPIPARPRLVIPTAFTDNPNTGGQALSPVKPWFTPASLSSKTSRSRHMSPDRTATRIRESSPLRARTVSPASRHDGRLGIPRTVSDHGSTGANMASASGLVATHHRRKTEDWNSGKNFVGGSMDDADSGYSGSSGRLNRQSLSPGRRPSSPLSTLPNRTIALQPADLVPRDFDHLPLARRSASSPLIQHEHGQYLGIPPSRPQTTYDDEWDVVGDLTVVEDVTDAAEGEQLSGASSQPGFVTPTQDEIRPSSPLSTYTSTGQGWSLTSHQNLAQDGTLLQKSKKTFFPQIWTRGVQRK
ncbi:hypothetical protein M427DRAFT_55369 [Gonapodya prolifera JEL478]|uniref:Uncharacterized protein n=1 Tax=Gonapodya prolifera (strain JEL478) TaxID=1344416 RepID=A0A139AHU7_GONPJ|nr:hypothetical protein M427DRAFT_55369 [Gonapodya prolifera JEL478]|eukprot:KXS16386.1 hypothetical protein M427DRAFT_55369 [Gonapodya prolifera JEL478]